MLCFHKVSFCRQERVHWEDKVKRCPTDAVCECECECECVCVCVCVCERERERKRDDSTGSGKGQMTGFYEGVIESTNAIKCKEFFVYLNNSPSWN
jgi:hypothetical protein